nr:uncharacterized protein At2g29880-like isoform X2 [Ipomoea batatas]GMC82557.1 uncharacterized protein At2g29880-like isoform X2 [Ipomoea batatas]
MPHSRLISVDTLRSNKTRSRIGEDTRFWVGGEGVKLLLPNFPGNTARSGGRRKRKISDRDEPITSQSFHNAAMILSETLVMVGDKLSKSIGTELTLQEKVQQLDKELIQIDELSNEEYLMALIKLPDRPNQMLVFFSLPPERRLEWVRAFLSTH